MLTLTEAKNKVAKSHGYSDWNGFLSKIVWGVSIKDSIDTLFDEAYSLYHNQQHSSPKQYYPNEFEIIEHLHWGALLVKHKESGKIGEVPVDDVDNFMSDNPFSVIITPKDSPDTVATFLLLTIDEL